MDVLRNFGGVVRVELTSADICAAMNAIQHERAVIWDVQYLDEIRVSFCLHKQNLERLRRLHTKRGEKLEIIARKGLYWRLVDLRKRPLLVWPLLLFVLVSIWLPGRILFIQIEGNEHVETKRIVEAAAECGIGFGASRKEIRSERMKNALLEKIPQLSWAGINTVGCTAVISVKERIDPLPSEEIGRVSSMIASRDGIIRQITVLRGNRLCAVGEAVKAGQVLISGYTDCGLSIQATNAQGEVFAETSRDLTVIAPTMYSQKGQILRLSKRYFLIIGKKRINFLNSSGILGASCAKIYAENYLVLPGGFVLPVAFGVETCIAYEQSDVAMPQDLSDFAQQYVLGSMYSGRILTAEENVVTQDDRYIFLGNYTCMEMIGITKIEESILEYGKNS